MGGECSSAWRDMAWRVGSFRRKGAEAGEGCAREAFVLASPSVDKEANRVESGFLLRLVFNRGGKRGGKGGSLLRGQMRG